MADDVCDVPLSAHRTLWTGREAQDEIAALRAEVDALKADCEQMDALTDERDFLRAEVERLTEANGLLLRAVQLATNATDAAERGHGQAALETGEWQERAERAEALLAKATAFKLDSNTRLVQEVISRDEVLWVLVISWKCVGSFASLAAALAAYKSREEGDKR